MFIIQAIGASVQKAPALLERSDKAGNVFERDILTDIECQYK